MFMWEARNIAIRWEIQKKIILAPQIAMQLYHTQLSADLPREMKK